MVRFANPEFFYLYWLLPLIILFFVGVFKYKKRLLKRLGDEELVQSLLANVSRGKQRWKVVLIILVLSLLIFSLANPQMGTRLEEVKRTGVDIFIGLDVSQSMLAEDVAPSRIAKAKHRIASFIDKLRGDRVGIIAFAGLAFVQCPLTLDYGAAKLFLNDIDVGDIPQPGTAIAEAIRTARRSFNARELKYKVLILITDGEDHEEDPVAAAKEAAKEGVIIYTIGIGSPQGAPIPEFDQRGRQIGYKKDRSGQIVTTKLDVLTLEKIAFETGGKFYISTTGEVELNKILEEIADMEKKELASRQFTQFEDRFQFFLFLSLVLLIGETLLSERRKIKQVKAVLEIVEE